MTDQINIEKVRKHWIDSSDKDYETMMHMFQSKDYNWSLFIGHIVLEKLIKASVIVERKSHAPFTHDLTKLASKSGLSFSENSWIIWTLLQPLILMQGMIVTSRHFPKNVLLNIPKNGSIKFKNYVHG